MIDDACNLNPPRHTFGAHAMFCNLAVLLFASSSSYASGNHSNGRKKSKAAALAVIILLFRAQLTSAAILWSDPGAMVVFDNGAGRDMLEGAVKRDDSANDTLYFKFHVDPLSDSTTEEYFAALELFEGDA